MPGRVRLSEARQRWQRWWTTSWAARTRVSRSGLGLALLAGLSLAPASALYASAAPLPAKPVVVSVTAPTIQASTASTAMSSQEAFIQSIASAARDSQKRTGVPASITIAQAILESSWGKSGLAKQANNFFGIKAQTKTGSAGIVWMNTWEVIKGQNVVKKEPFRKYLSAQDSFVDHGRFLSENQRYRKAMAAKDDARRFAAEINKAGYATDPNYAKKLIQLMDKYDLYRFNR